MSDTSRLLALPAELRDRIFGFALTSPHGLRYCTHITTSRNNYCPINLKAQDETTSHHFNQLKYVNRSLHTDTKGPELQHNATLHFAMQRGSKLSPSEELIKKDSPETVADPVRTCQQCPSLELHYVLSNWAIGESPSAAETSFFLCIGIAYTSAIRWYGYSELYQRHSPFVNMISKWIRTYFMPDMH